MGRHTFDHNALRQKSCDMNPELLTPFPLLFAIPWAAFFYPFSLWSQIFLLLPAITCFPSHPLALHLCAQSSMDALHLTYFLLIPPLLTSHLTHRTW